MYISTYLRSTFPCAQTCLENVPKLEFSRPISFLQPYHASKSSEEIDNYNGCVHPYVAIVLDFKNPPVLEEQLQFSFISPFFSLHLEIWYFYVLFLILSLIFNYSSQKTSLVYKIFFIELDFIICVHKKSFHEVNESRSKASLTSFFTKIGVVCYCYIEDDSKFLHNHSIKPRRVPPSLIKQNLFIFVICWLVRESPFFPYTRFFSKKYL